MLGDIRGDIAAFEGICKTVEGGEARHQRGLVRVEDRVLLVTVQDLDMMPLLRS